MATTTTTTLAAAGIVVTLDSTPGGISANSYVSLADALDYFTYKRLYADDFLNADSTKQGISLIMATAMIDDNFAFYGSKANQGQALQCPRTGLYDRDGFLYSSLIIPQSVKDATCELAISLLGRDRTSESSLLGIGLTDIKIGPLELKIDTDSADATVDALPQSVLSKLQFLGDPVDGDDGDSIGFMRVVRT